MKRCVLLLALFLASVPYAFAGGPGHGHHSSHVRNHVKIHGSRKSHASGSNDGTYQNGLGSSHKGGHYKNPKTHNHYRDRKHGTPQ